MERVDAIVVGGGVMGAASARSLARRDRDVVLLEQFGPGHTRGSSHGRSRIFRLAYPDAFWIDLARQARAEWQELEGESGTTLVEVTGSLDHGDEDGVRQVVTALRVAGVPAELLDPSEAERRWPGMRFDGPVCHQPDGGRIASDQAWAALVAEVGRLGGVARWDTPVRAIEAEGDRVRVVTDDAVYVAELVVLAAGGWLTALLDGLSGRLRVPELTVTQESAFHFAPRTDEAWPSFIHHGPTFVYGLETPGEGVKVAEHHQGPVVDAATRDFAVDDESRHRVTDFVERWLPGLEAEPASAVTCLYTSTADEAFVLDRVGPVIVASPCSGHGFKFAPLIGELVADLAGGGPSRPPFAFRY